MSKPRSYITKSGAMLLDRCEKAFHFWWNRKHETEFSPDALARMAMGTDIGKLAQGLAPGGIDIDALGLPPWKATQPTLEAMQQGKPVYEATFIDKSTKLLCKVDILVPDGDGWQIWEVKSGTGVKDDYITDAGFQLFTLQNTHVNVTKVCIVHLNNEYIRRGDIDIHQLFTITDITKEADDAGNTFIADTYREMYEKNGMEVEPGTSIGSRCSKGYECPYTHICWADFPQRDSVYAIPRLGKEADVYLKKGKYRLSDIDPTQLTDKQLSVWNAHMHGTPLLDDEAIAEFIAEARYPMYFLDFETYNQALPEWDGTRPYQQIPFQYSLHVIKEPGAEPEHYMFLDEGRSGDPRRAFTEQLLNECGEHGTVWVYNQAFENRILNELAEAFPEHEEALHAISERVMDLITPFRKLWYYHPDMQGSASIKDVLPVLVPELSYKELDIAQGGDAITAYGQLLHGELAEEEREGLLSGLREYCTLDTLAMVEIWKKLNK